MQENCILHCLACITASEMQMHKLYKNTAFFVMDSQACFKCEVWENKHTSEECFPYFVLVVCSAVISLNGLIHIPSLYILFFSCEFFENYIFFFKVPIPQT